jgi:hypothetical protein
MQIAAPVPDTLRAAHHGVVTGELHAVKAARVVREEGAGEGPASCRHLASVLPHFGGDADHYQPPCHAACRYHMCEAVDMAVPGGGLHD